MSKKKWQPTMNMKVRVERTRYPNGNLLSERCTINGLLNDLPGGTPAFRTWRPDGSSRAVFHYIEGKPGGADPWYEAWDEDGRRTRTGFLPDGFLFETIEQKQ